MQCPFGMRFLSVKTCRFAVAADVTAQKARRPGAGSFKPPGVRGEAGDRIILNSDQAMRQVRMTCLECCMAPHRRGNGVQILAGLARGLWGAKKKSSVLLEAHMINLRR